MEFNAESTIAYERHRDDLDISPTPKLYAQHEYLRRPWKYVICFGVLLSAISFGLALGATVMFSMNAVKERNNPSSSYYEKLSGHKYEMDEMKKLICSLKALSNQQAYEINQLKYSMGKLARSNLLQFQQTQLDVIAIQNNFNTSLPPTEKEKEQIEELTRSLPETNNQSLLIKSRKDCQDVARQGFRFSGIYKITVNNKTTPVFCDLKNDGGNWTVIQRRTGGFVDFYKKWDSYREGFGDLNTDFWLGLETIHQITNSGFYQLRVDLEDFWYDRAYAEYSTFLVGNESVNYQLSVSGYNGTASDGMKHHNNRGFTTKDRDNDNMEINCAVAYHGAWWYNQCFHSNLNGRYLGNVTYQLKGIIWYHWKLKSNSLKRVEMKIKPILDE